MIIFATKRLLVRNYEEGDEANFFRLNGDEEIMRYIRSPKTKEECDRFLRQIIEDANRTPLYGRWAVEEKHSGVFAGSFALIPVEGRDEMQLGYALLKEYWGQGYATELTRAGLEFVFTKTEIDPVYAYAEKPNLVSQKVLLKCGFSPVKAEWKGRRSCFLFSLPGRPIPKSFDGSVNIFPGRRHPAG
jgi:ribosomal-protein-alanine N-acetyltransferase